MPFNRMLKGPVLVVLAFAACVEDSDPPAPSTPDADVSMDASTGDTSSPATDASDEASDAKSPSDASAPDAAADAVSEAAPADASTDATLDAEPDAGAEGGTTKTWRAPVRVSADADGDVYSAQVAFSPTGNTGVATWMAYALGGNIGTIWANVFTVGSGWGTATRIDSVAFNAQRPRVAVDAAGNSFVVWQQDDSIGRTNIWTNRYVPGTGWTGAALLETLDGDTTFTRSADTVRIAASANGGARAIWTQADANFTTASIWDAVYTPGAGWGAPALAESAAFSVGAPSVAMDSTGNSMEVWVQSDGTNFNVWGRYNGGTPAKVETSTGANPSPPEVAMHGGEAVVVWSNGCSKWGNRSAAGVWGTAVELQHNATCALVPDSQVVMDANGVATAAWNFSTGASLTAYADVSNPGTGWAGAAPLRFGAVGLALATNAGGEQLAAWITSPNVLNATATPGATATTNTIVQATAAYAPHIAVAASGHAVTVFTFTESSGTRNAIWGSSFE